MRRLLQLLEVVLLWWAGTSSCVLPLTLPYNRELVPLPPQYAVWWQEMERCSGHHRPMRDFHFLVTPLLVLEDRGDSWVVGETYFDDRLILFTVWSARDPRVVRHEMLHALGFRTHDYNLFVRTCHVETDETILFQDHPVNVPRALYDGQDEAEGTGF